MLGIRRRRDRIHEVVRHVAEGRGPTGVRVVGVRLRSEARVQRQATRQMANVGDVDGEAMNAATMAFAVGLLTQTGAKLWGGASATSVSRDRLQHWCFYSKRGRYSADVGSVCRIQGEAEIARSESVSVTTRTRGVMRIAASGCSARSGYQSSQRWLTSVSRRGRKG